MNMPNTPAKPVSAPKSSLLGNIPTGLVCAIIFLLTLWIFWPATHYGFVNYDDPVNVDNIQMQRGLTWENIQQAFSRSVDNNWMPLTILSHLADHQWWGNKPAGHHVTNVVLHAINAVLVFLLLQGLTGAKGRSLAVALLFAVHPLRVESVVWVTERKDVLSGFFGLLVLIFYTRYVRAQKIDSKSGILAGISRFSRSLDAWLALGFFAMGLMSKPMLVTWPFVMLLLDWWPLKRIPNSEFGIQKFSGLLVEKIPFMVIAVVDCVVTLQVQGQGGTLAMNNQWTLGFRLANAMVSYVRYLGKILWPDSLAVFYPYPSHWPSLVVLMCGGLLTGVSMLCIYRHLKNPYMLVGWLWFLGTLIPVIGLIQAGQQSMADRYSYLPALGVLIFLVWGAYDLSHHWQQKSPLLLVFVGLAAILICGWLTSRQIGYWQSSETLFRHELEVVPDNYIARFNLGTALVEQGRSAEAIPQFQATLRLNPNDGEACGSLATALAEGGQIDDAVIFYQKALSLNPDDFESCINLAITFARQGKLDSAIGLFQQAILLRPNDVDAHRYLGMTFSKMGRLADAEKQFETIVRITPDDFEMINNLGMLYARQGKLNDAIKQFQRAAQLHPEDSAVHNSLGTAFAQAGRIEEAIGEFEAALRLDPGNMTAKRNLNFALKARSVSSVTH
jgi:protein O-mannosyl-transferase